MDIYLLNGSSYVSLIENGAKNLKIVVFIDCIREIPQYIVFQEFF